MVTGEADPYGEPNAFPQKIKNLEVSKAFPGPINGPHLPPFSHGTIVLLVYQSSTSALPDNA